MDKQEAKKNSTLDVMCWDMCFEIMYSFGKTCNQDTLKSLDRELSPGLNLNDLFTQTPGDMLDGNFNIIHSTMPEQDKTIPILPVDKVASKLKSVYTNKEVTPIFFKWSKNLANSPKFQKVRDRYPDVKNITADFPVKSYMSKVLDTCVRPIGQAIMQGDMKHLYIFLKNGMVRNWLMYFGSFQSYNKLLPYAIVGGLVRVEAFLAEVDALWGTPNFSTKKAVLTAAEMLNPLSAYALVLKDAGYDPKTLKYTGSRRNLVDCWDALAEWIQLLNWGSGGSHAMDIVVKIGSEYQFEKLPEVSEVYLRNEPVASRSMAPLKAPPSTIELPKEIISKPLTLSFTDKVEHGKLSHLEKDEIFIESKPMNPIFVPPEPEMEERVLVPAPKERKDIVVEIIEPKIKEPREEKQIRPQTIDSMTLSDIMSDSGEVYVSRYLVDCKFNSYLKSNPLGIPYQYSLANGTKTYPDSYSLFNDCKIVDIYGNVVYETIYMRQKLEAAIELLNKSMAGLPVDIHKLRRKAGSIEKVLVTQIVIALHDNCSNEFNTHNVVNLSPDLLPYIVKRSLCAYGLLYKNPDETLFRATQWLEFLVRNGDLLLKLTHPEYIPLLSRVYSWVIFSTLVQHSRSMLTSKGFSEPNYGECLPYRIEPYERWPYKESVASQGFSVTSGSRKGEIKIERIAAGISVAWAEVGEKPELTPEKPELTPEKPELTPEKPELTPEKSELTPEESELTLEKPEPTEEPIEAQPRPTPSPTSFPMTKEEEDLVVSAISKICRLHKIPLDDKLTIIRLILQSYEKG